MSAGASSATDRRSWVPIVLLTLLWASHRLAVALSAGDFLYPLEPSEAKHTQIAWDLASGTFGSRPMRAYVTNSGNVHHGSYLSVAASYVFSAAGLGWTALSMRVVPIVWGALAVALWLRTLQRFLGLGAAVMAAVGLLFVPTIYLGLQVTMLGSHTEAVLPLAAATWAWMRVAARGDGPVPPSAAALLGAAWGYGAAFSYLLWPFLALQALLLFALPRRPAHDGRAAAALATGIVIGLWPLWLILVLDPASLLRHSVTEDPGSSLGHLATGAGSDTELLWRTIRSNLPGSFRDWYTTKAQAPALLGGAGFESRAYKLAFLGPLLLLPWAFRERDSAVRRLGLFVALAPTLLYLFVCFASPWKPHIRERYLLAAGLLGWSAPSVLWGLGVRAIGEGTRRWGALAGTFALVALLWPLPARVPEALQVLRLDRAKGVLSHRAVLYYNLGIHTVWAEQAPWVNDLLAVRAAGHRSGDPHAWDGIQAGLGAGAPVEHLGLAAEAWSPPTSTFRDLRPGLREWSERQGYKPDQPEDPLRAAQNTGWGFGIRTGFDPRAMLAVVAEGRGSDRWPEALGWDELWYGWGLGCGRAHRDAPERCSLRDLESVDAASRSAAERGVRDGPSLAADEGLDHVQPASVRGPAT